MKRSLIFCAIALVAVAANTASASSSNFVNVELNLRYTDPADESAGGSWDLLVNSTGGGIAGVSVLIDNVTGATASGGTGFNVFETQIVGTVAEVVAGFDLVSPAMDVGLAGGTGFDSADNDLFPGNSPALWDNSVKVASGSFGGTRPSFMANLGTLDAGANQFNGSGDAIAATLGVMRVRGDGVNEDGLLKGDANRDGNVNLDDLTVLGTFFDQPGGWDNGDFNSSGTVNLDDLTDLGTSFGMGASPPSLSAVPEPTSALMLVVFGLGLAAVRKR